MKEFLVLHTMNVKILKNNNEFTTLLMQEMIKNNILWPSFISISFSHKKRKLPKRELKSLLVYKKLL